MSCPHLDAVVARFLDGDVDQGDGSPLEAHLAECAPCRRALAQSRHLDAAIAATVDMSLAEPDALVEKALASLAPTPTTVTSRRWRAWPLVLTAAAGFAIGLVVATRREPPPATLPHTPVTVADVEVATPPVPRDLFTIPDQNLPQWNATGGSEVRALDAVRRAELVLSSADLPAALYMLALARARSCALPGGAARLPSRETLARAETAARIDAARVLLASRSRAATTALARAAARDDATANALVPQLVDDRDFKARLRRELHDRCEREIAITAARLADPDLDRALLARCRRDDALADAVAAEARHVARPDGRIDFLLELWGTLTRGGADGSGPHRDDVDRAHAWFAGLGPRASNTLLDRLRTSRSAEFRSRCLVALAAVGRPEAVDALLLLVERPNLHEAQLAAYALGMLPADVIPSVRSALGRSRRTTLLWTALASLGDRAARDLVIATGTPFEPSARLRPEQIPTIAHALRGREPTPPISSRP